MGNSKHTVYISKSKKFLYFDDKKVHCSSVDCVHHYQWFLYSTCRCQCTHFVAQVSLIWYKAFKIFLPTSATEE